MWCHNLGIIRAPQLIEAYGTHHFQMPFQLGDSSLCSFWHSHSVPLSSTKPTEGRSGNSSDSNENCSHSQASRGETIAIPCLLCTEISLSSPLRLGFIHVKLWEHWPEVWRRISLQITRYWSYTLSFPLRIIATLWRLPAYSFGITSIIAHLLLFLLAAISGNAIQCAY